MTDTQPMAPTDAEIFVVAREVGLLPDNSHPAPETRAARKHSNAVQAFARAVLAKWGTPPAVAGEPFCYVSVNRQGDITRMMKRKDKWTNIPLYTTPQPTTPPPHSPQPTQPQAGAVPLTDEQIVEASCVYWGKAQLRNAFEAGARFAERHHGIKGGHQ